jgi:hypothetical protein
MLVTPDKSLIALSAKPPPEPEMPDPLFWPPPAPHIRTRTLLIPEGTVHIPEAEKT